MRIPKCLFALLVPLAVGACGGDEEPATRSSGAPATRRDRPAAAPAAAPAGEQRPIDPASVGSVKGVVHFEGQAPERKPIDMKVAGGCHAEGTVLTEQVIVNDGKLQNVFVRVKSGLAGWSVPPASSTPVVMNQQGCVYTPHVLGVRVGQPIEIQNSDEATHNVNARPQRRKNEAFNQLQLAGSAALTRTFGEEEVAVRFECNLHPWMNAWVAVVDHPFFAVSGPDGSFAIEGLPPGDYELEAWHERFGRTTARVSVSAGAAAEVSFTFEPR